MGSRITTAKRLTPCQNNPVVKACQSGLTIGALELTSVIHQNVRDVTNDVIAGAELVQEEGG